MGFQAEAQGLEQWSRKYSFLFVQRKVFKKLKFCGGRVIPGS